PSRTSKRSNTTEPPTPAMATRRSSVILPMDTAMLAVVSRNSLKTGGGGVALVEVRPLGSTVVIVINNTTDINTTEPNESRQTPNPAKTPPINGPDSAAIPHMPDNSAIARDHKGSAKTSRIMEYDKANKSPPPNP